MRSYEDISNRIMQRGDEIIESRKVRAAKIRHTTYAVSGMCAAVITGIGVWRATSSMPQPDNEHLSSAVATTETTAETSVTAAVKNTATQPATATENKKTSSSVTVSSSTAARTESSSTAARPKTTAAYSYIQTTTITKAQQTSVPTSIIESTTTTSLNEGPVTAVPHAVTTTLGQEIVKITDKTALSSECIGTLPTTTTTQTYSEVIGTLPFDYDEVIRSSHGVFVYNDGRYEKEGSLVPPYSIGEFIRNISVTFKAANNWDIVDGMALYEIIGIDKEEAVAAKFKDEYYMFRNVYYKKDDNIPQNDS